MRRVVFVCLTAALVAGCTSSRPVPVADEKKEVDDARDGKKEEADDGKAPHGGLIAAWSSERTDNQYHVEVCFDRGKP